MTKSRAVGERFRYRLTGEGGIPEAGFRRTPGLRPGGQIAPCGSTTTLQPLIECCTGAIPARARMRFWHGDSPSGPAQLHSCQAEATIGQRGVGAGGVEGEPKVARGNPRRVFGERRCPKEPDHRCLRQSPDAVAMTIRRQPSCIAMVIRKLPHRTVNRKAAATAATMI